MDDALDEVDIPSPPLLFWPHPPSNDGIFESIAVGKEADRTKEGLFRRLRELTAMLRKLESHARDVVTWADLCGDARSYEQRARLPEDSDRWMDFVEDVRRYIKRLRCRTNIIAGEVELTFQKIESLRESLSQRIMELEEKERARRR